MTDHPFLKALGQPERLSNCTCERRQETSFTAALQFLNGDSVRRQLRAPGGRVDAQLREGPWPSRPVEELYLAAPNRYPDEAERAALVPRLRKTKDMGKELRRVLWALINTREFQYRH